MLQSFNISAAARFSFITKLAGAAAVLAVGAQGQQPSPTFHRVGVGGRFATGVLRPANTAGNIAAYNTANQANVFIPRLPRYGRLTHHQERTGVTGALSRS